MVYRVVETIGGLYQVQRRGPWWWPFWRSIPDATWGSRGDAAVWVLEQR